MNRPEAEKLLGGYAAGILTEAEKRILFDAALGDQALFDALLDEEALRELLADPEARERLLAVLPRPGEGQVRRFWRRPAVIGLVASLFALVTTSLVILRRPEVPVFRSMPEAPRDTGTPPPRPRPGEKAEAAPLQAPPRKPSLPSKPRQAGAPERLERAEAAPGPVAAEAPAPPAEVSRSVPMTSKSLDFPFDPESLEAAPKGAKTARSKLAMAPETAAAPFETRLERLPDGQARLRVTWGRHGYLYVLKRTPSATTVVAPKVAAGDEGVTLFEFILDGRDLVDVYLLREPAKDPGSLPAEGPVAGERRRVHPE